MAGESRPAFLDFCAKDAKGFTREAPRLARRPPNGGIIMAGEVNRRSFLNSLGVSVGAALATAGGAIPVVGVAHEQDKPKGNIPDKPFKIGHMTFFTGPAAVLGEPMFKGQQLAAEEINAAGGLLGKRKIELLKADENAGTDANVKELRRLKLSENIDFFCGITSKRNPKWSRKAGRSSAPPTSPRTSRRRSRRSPT